MTSRASVLIRVMDLTGPSPPTLPARNRTLCKYFGRQKLGSRTVTSTTAAQALGRDIAFFFARRDSELPRTLLPSTGFSTRIWKSVPMIYQAHLHLGLEAW